MVGDILIVESNVNQMMASGTFRASYVVPLAGCEPQFPFDLQVAPPDDWSLLNIRLEGST